MNQMILLCFSYRAHGGKSLDKQHDVESGGPGTVFLYHLIYTHRTLLVDNDGRKPLNKHIQYGTLEEEGGKAWIMPESGIHHLAGNQHMFHFEELQIYNKAHLGIWPRASNDMRNVSLYFKYMIGDRSGMVHIGNRQVMDLYRPEIDLPFSAQVYSGGHLGLAPYTEIHGVEIILRGVLAYVENVTLHHGGQLWLNHGGRTHKLPDHKYEFDTVRIQDTGIVHCVTSPVNDPGIYWYTRLVFIEGGGLMRGSRLTFITENITIDDGGALVADYLGYNTSHGYSGSGIYGSINPGHGIDSPNGGSGAGHGGSGGRGNIQSGAANTGFAYDHLYEPDMFGSAGGKGQNGARGGNGGGVLWMNVTGVIDVDGIVSANGEDTPTVGSGGGSGGSIWMYCKKIKGYGKISANGGAGSINPSYPGGGGAGGRIAIYFQENETSTYFVYEARGGAALGCQVDKIELCKAEAGGPGTVFLYHMIQTHRTLLIHNGGQKPLVSAIDDYSDLSQDGGRAWLLPESGQHQFAGGQNEYHFEELQIYGGGHLAVLTEPVGQNVSLFFRYMVGDRTGTLHVSENQVMDLHRPEIDIPFSVHVYWGGFLGLAPYTEVHGVTLYISGVLGHIQNMTLHHGGAIWMNHGGKTTNQTNSTFQFDAVRVQDRGLIRAVTSPLNEPGITVIVRALFIEGGGLFHGTRLTVLAENITIDDGGKMAADGLGYNVSHPSGNGLHGVINPGIGATSAYGSSGGGHGGHGGRGKHSSVVGRAYGDLYEPLRFGSCGGGPKSGSGGGVIWFNVTNVIHINGEVSANGARAADTDSGGGSGGSIWMHCYTIKGTGKIAVNGGAGGASSGGGAGGRTSVYFTRNSTFTGRFESQGGAKGGQSNTEAGGPGTTFLYHLVHTHRTLHIDNGGQHPLSLRISDYSDLSQDACRAWILSESGKHRFANSSHSFHFEELQIYGGAHLAILTEPIDRGASLFFQNMIGDRTGMIHVGKNQVMDLRRSFLDIPFSAYIYEGGYLGLAPISEMNKISVHVEGTLDHVKNLTILNGGALHGYLTGSTGRDPPRHYVFNETVRIMADSKIQTHSPHAHSERYTLQAKILLVEGGARIETFNMLIHAKNLTVDDGGAIDAGNGGYLATKGPGSLLTNNWKHSGAGHGGTGGRGSCGGYQTCRLRKGLPYGSVVFPRDYGSGGDGPGGGTGGGVLDIQVEDTLQVITFCFWRLLHCPKN